MTMSEAGTLGIPDEMDIIEELPHEEIEAAIEQPAIIEQPTVRHLAGGASTTTLCGLPRTGQKTAHPSKATKSDCLNCRTILRDANRKKEQTPSTPSLAVIIKGARIAYEDNSAWLVEDIRDGGMDLVCLVPSKAHAKGRRTTISKDAFVRLLDDEQFSELVAMEKPVKAEGIVSLPPRGDAEGTVVVTEKKPRPTGKWAPTAAEVEEVKRLRALSHSYIAIEKEMGWPDGHGNRPWKIMKGKLTAE